jgi:signal transduction histidine kinase
MDDESNSGPLVALLVEDNSRDADLIAARLESDTHGAQAVRVLRASGVETACAALRDSAVDVVFLDLSLPDADWLDALHRVRGAVSGVPIIVLADSADEAPAMDALRAGAQDYLLKPPPDGPVLRRILRYARERQRLLDERDSALASRDRVVGMVSHDLRTPLSTIQMCAAALQDPEAPPPSGARGMGDLIQRSAEWMLQIVQDFLDRVRLEAGQLVLDRQPLVVAELVGAAQALFAPIAGVQAVEFVVECAAGLPPLIADSHRLTQVLSNLLGNAIRFSRAGGRVLLSAREAEPEDADGWDHAVSFTVSDSGPGIAPESLGHLFDWLQPPHRTRRVGSGPGLAVSKRLVEAHGGQVHARSEVGRGSTFWFTVPAGGGIRLDTAHAS